MDRKTIINKAGVYAPIFALISIAYTLLGLVIPSGKFIWSVLSFVIWAAKFAGIIVLMMYLMKKVASEGTDVRIYDLRRMGNYISLFSAILVASFTYVLVVFIAPDTFDQAVATALASSGQMLDSNSRKALEWLSENFGTVSFISNLFYCYIFGVILSSICAGRLISDNPFENNSKNSGNSEEDE